VSGFNILDHYWIFGDVNPTTQVYSSAVGAMVANNAAAYLTWLAGLDYTSDGGSGNGLPISNVENNGSGACRVTINTTAEMATGQRWRVAGVQGVSGANGTFQITVVNSTKIDLVGSTFSGAYTSGGFVLGPTFAATAASLAQVLNSAALESLVPSSNDITSAVNVTLSNPLSATTKVNMTATGKAVTLPPMDRANSYPLNEPFTVINSGANAWDLKTNAGTVLGTLAPQASWQLKNTNNSSAAGSFEIIITLYNSGTQGILQVAPKTDSATAQGDWTNLAHQSNPGQFDGRNNEVWGFGYNIDATWNSRNGSDDGATLGRIETHYYPNVSTGPAIEYHYACASKAAGGEVRALSFAIQKAGSVNPSPYYVVGSISAHEFRITRPSDSRETFGFSPQNAGGGTLGTFQLNDSYINIANLNAANATLQVYDQRKASTDLLIAYQFNSVGKWFHRLKASTVNWELYDEAGANAVHTTWYSNGGTAVGTPTGGDKGRGKLNAEGLYVHGSAVLTGNQTVTLSGDVTGSGATSISTTIATDAVSNAKLANMASGMIKGRRTASTGDPEDLSASDVLTILDPAPAVLVDVSRSTDQTVTANTWTKMQLSTETTDIEGIYDNATNYRCTPTKAGMYLVTAMCVTTCGDGGYGAVAIYKNGTFYEANFCISGATQVNGIAVTAFVPMNGSTDYIEAFGYSSDGANPKFTSGSLPCHMKIMRVH
jgi:hypothetical protein